jgi:glycosyltransferase involved in cell wall biosynthesis
LSDFIFLLPTLKSTGGNIIVREYVKILEEKGYSAQVVGYLQETENSIFQEASVTSLSYTFHKYLSLALFMQIELPKLWWIFKNKKQSTIVTNYTPLSLVVTLLWLAGVVRKPKIIVHDSLNMKWIGWLSFKLILPLQTILLGKESIAFLNQKQVNDVGFLVNKNIFKFIQNGISEIFFEVTPEYAIKNSDRLKESLEILYVGSPTLAKGWDVICKHSNLMQKLGQKVSVRAFLTSKPKDVPTKNFFVFVGRNHKDIIENSKDCSILISASRSDSFSLPIVEAMCRFIFPICSYTSGSRLHSSNGAHIFFYDFEDESTLFDAIKKYLDFEPHERLKLLLENRKYAESFKWQNSSNQLAAFLLR